MDLTLSIFQNSGTPILTQHTVSTSRYAPPEGWREQANKVGASVPLPQLPTASMVDDQISLIAQQQQDTLQRLSFDAGNLIFDCLLYTSPSPRDS